MVDSEDRRTLQTAVALHQAGNLETAAELYRKIIGSNPKSFQALHYLGMIEATLGNYEEAKALMDRSLSMRPPNIQFVQNYATILFQTGDYKSALKVCIRGLQLSPADVSLLYVSAISLLKLRRFEESITQFDDLLYREPDHIAAINERGSVLAELGRYDEALVSFDKVLAFQPQYAFAHLNKANLLGVLKNYKDALAGYDKALALNPDLAAAWLGRGNVLRILKRHDEALATYEKALALAPDLADAWLGRGNAFWDIKRHDEALAAYDKALAFKPDLADAWLGRGNVVSDLKHFDEALAAYDKTLALKPDLAEAWLGRGNVFTELRRDGEALAAYDKALALKPDLAEAWLGRGNVFTDLKRHDDAFAAYDRALAIKPDLEGAEGARLHAKMQLCVWSNFEAENDRLILSVRKGHANAGQPFQTLAIPSSASDQLECAKLWVSKRYPPHPPPFRKGPRRHDRPRIAYASSDLREHPTAFLMAGVFECHDKSQFEITAVSLEPDDKSEMRERLGRSFELWFDASTSSDEEIASYLNDREIDIMIDLNGHTKHARTNVFARRAAPIQVNYLGYPGTTGASYIDYLIADAIVLPDASRGFYSEKIVTLPNTYQANDRGRLIANKSLSRSDEGLPSHEFVFCCFNNNYKITPYIFDRWMSILKQVEGSVLWLFESNASAATNLKREAAARGLNPDRLIFAKHMPPPQHLARHRLADLFLDTLPYNAHTTASDALWAGLPLLTCPGKTFAGNVAASLLNAIQLPELIAPTLEVYEQMAVDLAMHPEKLIAAKHKLAEHRLTTPLFDTELFTRHIEAAYMAMYERYQAGLAPDHLVIPN